MHGKAGEGDKMKKRMSMALSILCALGLITGCGSQPATDKHNPAEETSEFVRSTTATEFKPQTIATVATTEETLVTVPVPHPMMETTAEPQTEKPAETQTTEPSSETTVESHRGTATQIPSAVRDKMAGISMPEGATVSYDDLRYLTIPHIGYDGESKVGHMVVAKELADEVLDIFAELYGIGYPIESMELIDEFNDKQTAELDSLDRASMGNNNTSAFCYRVVSGTQNISQHAYGRAIDLNPKTNPYVSRSGVSPRNAKKYADRDGTDFTDAEQQALIHSGDEAYSIFISYGWEWGGEIWAGSGIYDYQHFQKPKTE